MSQRYFAIPPPEFISNKRKLDACRSTCAKKADRFNDYFMPIDLSFSPGTFPGLSDNEIAKLQNLSARDVCTYMCYKRS